MDYAAAMARLGEVLADRYRIDAPLGVGGMATVQRARDLRLGRDVAVKILLPNLATDGALVDRFVGEAHALAAINHPAVVSVYDVDPGDPASGREPFYVMELCSDGSLADRLRVGGPLSPEVAVPWLASVADGLAELHRHGLVHRDVKPQNVLISGERAKLGDLGIVLAESGADVELTAEGTTLGTLAYLAPERLVGRPATHAADVYGLAASAYEALSGRRPRRSGTVAELVERRADPPPALAALRPELGPWFDPPILAGLAPDPAARPEAAALGRALTTALGAWRQARGALQTSVVAAAGDAASGAAAAAVRSVPGPTPLPTRLPPTAATPGVRPDRSPGILRPPRPLRHDPVTQGLQVASASSPFRHPGPSIAGPAFAGPAAAGRSGSQGVPSFVPYPDSATRRPPAGMPRPAAHRAGAGSAEVAMGLIAGIVVMVALVVVTLSVAAWLQDGRAGTSGTPGASLPGVAGLPVPTPTAAITPAPPRATPRPSPSPTPQPSPQPSPTPALSPAIASAVGTMRTAIDHATGHGGLTGKEAASLSSRLADVESAASSGDRAGAIAASGRLTTDVVGLVLGGRIGGPAGDRLFTSALALGAAVATA
jgi:hypothetical protein